MKIRLNLALWIIPVLLYSYSNIAYAATFTQIAELQGQSPIEMDQGEQLPGFVDFGFEFETIENVSINIFFAGDLFDPGEALKFFFPSRLGIVGLTGSNDTNSAMDEFQFFEMETTLLLVALMDGSTDFFLKMVTGNTGVEQVSFDVTGTTAPLPSALLLFISGLMGLYGMKRIRK